jgi:hypothetical protein
MKNVTKDINLSGGNVSASSAASELKKSSNNAVTLLKLVLLNVSSLFCACRHHKLCLHLTKHALKANQF